MTFLHQHQGILIKKNDTEVSLLTFYFSQSGLSLCWCWLPTDRTEKSGDASSVSSNMVILFFPYSNLFLALSMMTLVFFITLYDSLLQSPSPLTTLTTCFATGPQTSTSMSWSMWWVKMMQAINSSIAIISQILQLLFPKKHVQTDLWALFLKVNHIRWLLARSTTSEESGKLFRWSISHFSFSNFEHFS